MPWPGAHFINGFSIAIQIQLDSRFAEISIPGYSTITKFCLCHDNTAVVSDVYISETCSYQFIRI